MDIQKGLGYDGLASAVWSRGRSRVGGRGNDRQRGSSCGVPKFGLA